MSVEFTSGVLVADLLEGMKFALGPTTATRKDVLAHIGGLGVLADYHSEDYEIGRLVDAAGYRVLLSHVVIDHVTLNRAMISRQIRWMRCTRSSRPAGHIGNGLTFATPFALLGFIVAAAWGHWTLALALLGWGFANRWLQALVVGWRRGARSRNLALPLVLPVSRPARIFLLDGQLHRTHHRLARRTLPPRPPRTRHQPAPWPPGRNPPPTPLPSTTPARTN